MMQRSQEDLDYELAFEMLDTDEDGHAALFFVWQHAPWRGYFGPVTPGP